MFKITEWTETEKETLRKYFPTESKESISSILNRTFDTIRCKAKRMGIRRIIGAQWTQEETDILHRLYPSGKTKELVLLLHRSFNTISCQAQRLGIQRLDYTKQPLQKRFEKFVMPEPNSGCWLWTGGTDGSGYGQIGNGHGKTIHAHRASWLIYKGLIPDGLSVLHKCDNPPCVNPQHLFLGTQQDNITDCCNKKRQCIGQERPIAKLTNEMVIAIRRDPRTHKEIAIAFNISRTTVAYVKNGKTWKHVSGGPVGYRIGPYYDRRKVKHP